MICPSFLIFFHLICLVLAKLNILVVTTGRSSGSGTEALSPAFDIALQDAAVKYPALYKDAHIRKLDFTGDVDSTSLEQQSSIAAPVSQAIFEGVKASNTSEPFIVVTSVGTGGYPLIGDLTRELNVLSITCGSVELPRQRFPTSLYLFPGSVTLFGEALLALMLRFQWTHMAVLSDRLTGSPLASRSKTQCQGCLKVFQRNVARIQHSVIDMDSNNVGDPFESALLQASNFSRVILSCTLHAAMRRLMVKAQQLNMTSGSYVFIFLYELEVPSESPLRWKHDDIFDQILLRAFDNVLVLATKEINYTLSNPIAERIVRHRSEVYGTGYDSDQKFNEFMINCYEGVELISAGLSSLYTTINSSVTFSLKPALFDAGTIADDLTSRPFPSFLRDVVFLPNGERRPEVVVQSFDEATQQFTDVLYYELEPVMQTWASMPSTSPRLLWKGGEPPPDRPPCGLHGELCGSPSQFTTYTSATLSVALLLLIILFCVFFVRKFRRRIRPDIETWWVIDHANVLAVPLSEARFRYGPPGATNSTLTVHSAIAR